MMFHQREVHFLKHLVRGVFGSCYRGGDIHFHFKKVFLKEKLTICFYHVLLLSQFDKFFFGRRIKVQSFAMTFSLGIGKNRWTYSYFCQENNNTRRENVVMKQQFYKRITPAT